MPYSDIYDYVYGTWWVNRRTGQLKQITPKV